MKDNLPNRSATWNTFNMHQESVLVLLHQKESVRGCIKVNIPNRSATWNTFNMHQESVLVVLLDQKESVRGCMKDKHTESIGHLEYIHSYVS